MLRRGGVARTACSAQLTAKGKGKEGTSNSKGDGHNKQGRWQWRSRC